MAGSFGTYLQGGLVIEQKYYNARKISGTNTIASRLPVIEDLRIGDIVTVDPFDFEAQGIGNTVGSVLSGTGFLSCRHYIVVGFHPDVNRLIQPNASTTNNANLLRAGGAIEVVACGSGSVACRTKANMVIGVTGLQVTNSASDTTTTGDGTKPWLSLITDISTVIKFQPWIAIAGETVDTSSTLAVKNVLLAGASQSVG